MVSSFLKYSRLASLFFKKSHECAYITIHLLIFYNFSIGWYFQLVWPKSSANNWSRSWSRPIIDRSSRSMQKTTPAWIVRFLWIAYPWRSLLSIRLCDLSFISAVHIGNPLQGRLCLDLGPVNVIVFFTWISFSLQVVVDTLKQA